MVGTSYQACECPTKRQRPIRVGASKKRLAGWNFVSKSGIYWIFKLLMWVETTRWWRARENRSRKRTRILYKFEWSRAEATSKQCWRRRWDRVHRRRRRRWQEMELSCTNVSPYRSHKATLARRCETNQGEPFRSAALVEPRWPCAKTDGVCLIKVARQWRRWKGEFVAWLPVADLKRFALKTIRKGRPDRFCLTPVGVLQLAKCIQFKRHHRFISWRVASSWWSSSSWWYWSWSTAAAAAVVCIHH